MSKFTWVKLHHSSLRDVKVCQLSDGAYRLFANLLILANESDDRDGLIPLGDNLKQVLFDLRADAKTFHTFASEIADAGIIEYGQDAIDIKNFCKYQDSNSTERVRRFRQRERAKEAEASLAEAENGRETGMKRDETPCNAVKRDETNVTPEEKERRERIEGEGEETPPSPSFAKTYSHPPENSSDDLVHTMITNIAGICSQTYSHRTENDYADVAYELIGYDAQSEDFSVFEEYWKIHTYYDNRLRKAALRTISNEWKAAMEWRKNGRPLPEKAKPKVDKVGMVDAIVTAVNKHGRNRFAEAKESLGTDLWALVKKSGGWYAVCDTPQDQIKFKIFAVLGEVDHALPVS